MAEIKKIDTSSIDIFKANILTQKTNEGNKQKFETITIKDYNPEEINLKDNEDNDNYSPIPDVVEEVGFNIMDETARTGAIWLSNPKNLLYSNIDISLTNAEIIGGAAFRTIRFFPAVSAIAQPTWTALKYTTIEGEGIEGITNHKYEITGAAIGGIVSAGAIAIIMITNPAGWVSFGVAGLCIAGSIVAENIGAYYDTYGGIPTDYMSDVYFY